MLSVFFIYFSIRSSHFISKHLTLLTGPLHYQQPTEISPLFPKRFCPLCAREWPWKGDYLSANGHSEPTLEQAMIPVLLWLCLSFWMDYLCFKVLFPQPHQSSMRLGLTQAVSKWVTFWMCVSISVCAPQTHWHLECAGFQPSNKSWAHSLSLSTKL
jgi:hypothetical protein